MKIDAADHARDTDPLFLGLRGMVRRMAISLTTKALWQLLGFRLPDGTIETRTAEVFSGIGLYARPPSSGKPEAITMMVGADGTTPVIVATRDEATRSKVAGGIASGETMLFNALSVLYMKADGTVEIRSPSGVAEPMIKGATYRSAEDTLMTALGTFATAIGALNPATAAAAATTLNAAIATFQAAAATYLATVGKVQ